MSGNPDAFDYKRILTLPLKRMPFMTDLADACNEVLGREVEERRRRLERSKDSQRARKGQVLSWINYLPDSDKPAVYEATGLPVADLIPGDSIPKGRVLRIINNIGIYGATSAKDYLELEFVAANGQRARWLMPFDAPQERQLMISNNYTLGFDFFNSTLSDEDYQRLYEYLNMFWPENGRNDLFIKFIGFIKNLNLDLVPLWSYDDGTDKISVLEEINETRVKAVNGGPWYLTSHVAVNYDLNEQSNIYPINLDEIVELFYLFAPIMLVLERIVGTLDVPMAIGYAVTPSAAVINYGCYDLNHFAFQDNRIAVTQANVVNYGVCADPDYLTLIANPQSNARSAQYLLLGL